jgi:hypothetical protein
VIHWSIEEALNLRGVKVHNHEAIGASGLEEIGHQTSGDWLTTTVLLVLTGVAIKGSDNCDALCRCALESVDHDQLLHDLLIYWSCMALNNECIRTTNRFFKSNEYLAIGKVICGSGSDRNAKFSGDIFS